MRGRSRRKGAGGEKLQSMSFWRAHHLPPRSVHSEQLVLEGKAAARSVSNGKEKPRASEIYMDTPKGSKESKSRSGRVLDNRCKHLQNVLCGRKEGRMMERRRTGLFPRIPAPLLVLGALGQARAARTLCALSAASRRKTWRKATRRTQTCGALDCIPNPVGWTLLCAKSCSEIFVSEREAQRGSCSQIRTEFTRRHTPLKVLVFARFASLVVRD